MSYQDVFKACSKVRDAVASCSYPDFGRDIVLRDIEMIEREARIAPDRTKLRPGQSATVLELVDRLHDVASRLMVVVPPVGHTEPDLAQERMVVTAEDRDAFKRFYAIARQ